MEMLLRSEKQWNDSKLKDGMMNRVHRRQGKQQVVLALEEIIS